MKAAVYRRYGPPEVLQILEVARPEPRDDEIRVRVRAATAAAGDRRMRQADPFAARLFNGLIRPRRVTILGFELAGDVDAVGRAVTRFRVGDAVFAFTGFGFGANAEYRCLPEATASAEKGLVALKPANLTYEEAAAVPVGGLTAQAFIRKGGAAAGQRVLIYGASGSVGTFAVQLAHHLGAEVTGVCSTANVDLVKSLGAGRVIDYTQADFAAGGQVYDLLFDAVGKLTPAHARRALKRSGRFLSVTGSAPLQLDDLDTLRLLCEAGQLRAVIDRRYRLDQIVAAHRYLEAGHKKGNVVITVSEAN